MGLENCWRSRRSSGQVRDVVLALPGFTTGTLPSLRVSLTLNLSIETSRRCSPTFTPVQSYRKQAPPFYSEIKVRPWSSFIACFCHKVDVLSFCSKEHSHHFEHQSPPILFHICTLTSPSHVLTPVQTCHVLMSLNKMNSCLHPHPILPAFSGLAEPWRKSICWPDFPCSETLQLLHC